MIRTPAPQQDRPKCFGLDYVRDDAMCVACPANVRCGVVMKAAPSLSQLRRDAEAALDVTAVADVEAVYIAAYRQAYGRAPRYTIADAAQRAFRWVATLVRLTGVDPVEYMEAQLVSMRKSDREFYPSMLTSAKAVVRYRTYLRAGKRKYSNTRRGQTEVFPVRRIRSELAHGEFLVGEYYVAHIAQGHMDGWDYAAARSMPGEVWVAAQDVSSEVYKSWVRAYSRDLVERVQRCATLSAACRVMSALRPGLADWIGVRSFSWEALAALVVRLDVVPPAAEDVGIGKVPGELWTPGRLSQRRAAGQFR